MKKLCLAFLVPYLIVLPACSLTQSSMVPVTVSATAQEASLFADGQPIGTGIATVNLKRDEPHTFMAKMDDGRVGTMQVGRSLSDTAMLDIVGGFFFLIPFIGLAAPGAWDLDSTNVVIPVPTN